MNNKRFYVFRKYTRASKSQPNKRYKMLGGEGKLLDRYPAKDKIMMSIIDRIHNDEEYHLHRATTHKAYDKRFNNHVTFSFQNYQHDEDM